MKVLVISDIHSNYEALQAVADREKADAVWCLGDLVDYGPDPAEVVEWVRNHAQYCIRGNHDHAMAFGVDCGCSEAFRELSQTSREMNRKLLLGDHVEYLRQLPVTRNVIIGDYRFVLAHATPSGDLYPYLKPNAPDEEFEKWLEGVKADFVFYGHTHLPTIRKIGETLIVNPGSVGQQRDGDPRASCAVWEDGEIRLERIAYDVEKTVKKLRSRPLPSSISDQLARILMNGRSG